MTSYWIAVGSASNWLEAFSKGNIWGLRPRQKHRWQSLAEGDVVLFYVTEAVAGVIGYGPIQTKFIQDQPLWLDEIKEGKVIWPLRFEFNVDYCLPPDKWESNRITSDTLKLKVAVGFQSCNPQLAEQIISQLKQTKVEKPAELPLHRELQHKLVEVGKLQRQIAECEYVFDIGKFDVVWRRIEGSVPTYVFEVQVGGDLYHALTKLKHAFDLWNSRLFLVASPVDQERARKLLAGSFHEISERIRFIDLDKVDELYERKKSYLDFEKELGI